MREVRVVGRIALSNYYIHAGTHASTYICTLVLLVKRKSNTGKPTKLTIKHTLSLREP